MGKHSQYPVDEGALMFLLSSATSPQSTRIISRKLLGGTDRHIKGIQLMLSALIAAQRVKAVPVVIHGKTYEHYIIRSTGMADYHINASSKGTLVKTLITTDDPQRAIRFAKLLAASGRWENLTVEANKTTYTLETLEQLV